MENLKKTIGKNLANLRKERKLTQLDIAEMYGYSDKAVSKREKGDTLPDVETLYQLASFYGVTLDYLTVENKVVETDFVMTDARVRRNRIIIVCLLSTLVWMIAMLIFAWVMIFNKMNLWQTFLVAIPVNCLVLAYFNKIWGKRIYFFYIYSIFIWSVLVSIYCIFYDYMLWPLFLIGIPAQIVLLLWANMKDTFRKTISSTNKKTKEDIKKVK